MKNNLWVKLLAMMLALVMCAGFAVAEEEEDLELDFAELFGAEAMEDDMTITPEQIGNVVQRGLIIGFTQEDMDMGLTTSYTMAATNEVAEVPLFNMVYADAAGLFEAMTEMEAAGIAMDSEEGFFMVLSLFAESYHDLCSVALFEKEYYDEKTADGTSFAAALGVEEDEIEVIGENDGYVYCRLPWIDTSDVEDEGLKARLDEAVVRAKELLANVEFQPIEFDEGEFLEVPENFGAFSTHDLDGNAVTEAIFAEKDVTVINIWATWCGPCKSEMPELGEWAASMPENAQLIGIVHDVNSLEDAEMVAEAKAICEETGAGYISLIANETLDAFLENIMAFPTTLFVDSEGNMIADPVQGVNPAACKNTLDELLAAF